MNSRAESESFDLLKMDRRIVRRSQVRRVAGGLPWVGLVLYGASRRDLVGTLAVLYGLHRVRRWLQEVRPDWRLDLPKLLPVGRAKRDREGDRVDNAVWESFPASDPPAYTP